MAMTIANVPFSQTVDLVQRLRAQHVPFEQLILPDEIHGFPQVERLGAGLFRNRRVL